MRTHMGYPSGATGGMPGFSAPRACQISAFGLKESLEHLFHNNGGMMENFNGLEWESSHWLQLQDASERACPSLPGTDREPFHVSPFGDDDDEDDVEFEDEEDEDLEDDEAGDQE